MDGDVNKNCQKKQTDAERLNSVKDDDVNGYVMETWGGGGGGRTGPATEYPVRRTFSGTNNDLWNEFFLYILKT